MTTRQTAGLLLSAALLMAVSAAAACDAGTSDGRAQATEKSLSGLPGESLYRLPVMLTTAEGQRVLLASLPRRPRIITMFYSQCTSVCPVLTNRLQSMTNRLSANERRRLDVLMVSFDSARDTPDALTNFIAEHHLARDHWMVAAASAADVRLLAAALGIQYRELADHSFNHTAVLSMTDGDGVVREQTEDLADSDGKFAAAIRRQLRRSSRHAHPISKQAARTSP